MAGIDDLRGAARSRVGTSWGRGGVVLGSIALAAATVPRAGVAGGIVVAALPNARGAVPARVTVGVIATVCAAAGVVDGLGVAWRRVGV